MTVARNAVCEANLAVRAGVQSGEQFHRRRAFQPRIRRAPAPIDRSLEPAILVVDDDPSILEMLRDVLTREGYRVIPARDGMEGLAAIERETPFLVLLDLLLPLLDGRSFVNAVGDQGLRVPIVIVTASESWREIHADGIITKPFDLDELLQVVARFRDLAIRHSVATVGS